MILDGDSGYSFVYNIDDKAAREFIDKYEIIPECFEIEDDSKTEIENEEAEANGLKYFPINITELRVSGFKFKDWFAKNYGV